MAQQSAQKYTLNTVDDEWNYISKEFIEQGEGGLDVNLWVEDGIMRMSVSPLITNADGYLQSTEHWLPLFEITLCEKEIDYAI